jgi:hypothetical protein
MKLWICLKLKQQLHSGMKLCVHFVSFAKDVFDFSFRYFTSFFYEILQGVGELRNCILVIFICNVAGNAILKLQAADVFKFSCDSTNDHFWTLFFCKWCFLCFLPSPFKNHEFGKLHKDKFASCFTTRILACHLYVGTQIERVWERSAGITFGPTTEEVRGG